MSMTGFKKQFNKTSQYLSEKVGGNKGSEVDEDIIELGRKLDVVNDCVEKMQDKTKEYLQPNPSARTKLAVLAQCQRVRGQVSSAKYTQPEFNLGDVFAKGGGELDDASPYSLSLLELGSSFKELADVKDAMEDRVQQVFLVPLSDTQTKDLREINNHRKKLESRRLDYDYKRNKGEKVMAEVLQAAEDKYLESTQLCYDSMLNFMENDTEHVSQLHAFSEVIHDYHKQCMEVMATVTKNLSAKLSDAASQTKTKRRIISPNAYDNNNDQTIAYDSALSTNGKRNSTRSGSTHKPDTFAPPVLMPLPPAANQGPSCRALYDFDAENDGELGFAKGDVIELKSRIDENWLEGSNKGKIGFFPENFVETIVPLS